MTEGLKGIIPRTRELGRLRTGDSVPVVDRQTRKPVLNDDGSPKMRPARRHTWRITSASQTLLETAAELYGGTVTEWTDAPTPGQWELATERDSIEVLIPYDDSSLSQAFELWRAGGCERRCNGEVMDGGERCVCPADIEARMAGAALRTPTACKPTTRLNVLLPDIGELGFFRLEAHGYHAASEIPGQLALQQGIKVKLGDPNPWFTAWLRIDPRSGKKDGKTTQYTVPVVELPIKARSLMVDPVLQDPAAALSPGTSQAEGGSTPALGAGVGRDTPYPACAPAERRPPQRGRCTGPSPDRVGVRGLRAEGVAEPVPTGRQGAATRPARRGGADGHRRAHGQRGADPQDRDRRRRPGTGTGPEGPR